MSREGDTQAGQRSLAFQLLPFRPIRKVRGRGTTRYVTSSIKVGVGETDEGVYETLADLRANGVQIVTLGQYLRPSPRHAPVARYVVPGQLHEYRPVALELGFAYAASGPLVRSSYRAAEVFVQAASLRAAMA